MSSKPLLIFDFDGVIIDGMIEYWSSSQKACLKIIGKTEHSNLLNEKIPHKFRALRPWVTHGWEMVLIAAELFRKDSLLFNSEATIFSNQYEKNIQHGLQSWKLSPKQLQESLDNVRLTAIKTNLNNWIAKHKPFPQVVNRIQKLKDENIDFGVLTTKGTSFTSQLLNNLNLHPKFIYGHESGSKPNMLLEISRDQRIAGFIEDRRDTLETVLNTPGLQTLPCYLADWGYLKPDDKTKLPSGIHLLEKKKLLSPLANWH